jgi:nickel-type superoxide dismutase maturation protease
VHRRLLSITAVAIAIAATACALLRPRRVVVVGESMLPALQPGDRLLLLRLPAPPGAVVAVADPREPARILVKRLAARPEPGRRVVLGDNPAASTDSAHFGAVPAGLVRGRAVYRYAPAHRRGPVRSRPPGGWAAATTTTERYPMSISWPSGDAAGHRARTSKGVS